MLKTVIIHPKINMFCELLRENFKDTRYDLKYLNDW